jgi:hypothetical protein
MVSLDTLPSDILLHIVATLSLNDTVSLSMVEASSHQKSLHYHSHCAAGRQDFLRAVARA